MASSCYGFSTCLESQAGKRESTVSGKEYLLPLQKVGVQLLAFTWWLTTTSNTNSKRYDTFLISIDIAHTVHIKTDKHSYT